jgi:hypothetical protein
MPRRGAMGAVATAQTSTAALEAQYEGAPGAGTNAAIDATTAIRPRTPSGPDA